MFNQIQLAVTASGADNCTINADVFVNGNSVSIIEMGGRTGATCIPELISAYYCFDFYELMLRNALGEDVSDILSKIPINTSNSTPYMAKLLFSENDGTIIDIDESQLRNIKESGAHVVIDYAIGHPVRKISNGTNRIGHIIASVTSESQLDNMLNDMSKCIKIE